MRERYQIRGRFVLFAGNIKPHKNLERLIRAFARVRGQEGNEDVRLVLIGDEVSRYSSLRRTADEAGVRQDVRFFGFVPDTRRSRRSTAWPRCSPSRRSTRASACRRSRRWPAARRSSPRASRPCPRSSATARCSSTPTTRTTSPGDRARARRRRRCAPASCERGLRRAASFSWERSVRQIHAGYLKVLGRAGARHRGGDELRVALVHDWLTGMRGGEKVLLSLCPALPRAPRSSRCSTSAARSPRSSRRARSAPPSSQRLPAVATRYRHYLPLFPRAAESFDLARLRSRLLELALRRQGRAAGAGRAPPLLLPHADALRLGPLRRLLRTRPRVWPVARLAIRPIAARLRAWDVASSARVHHFVANSALRRRPHPPLLRPRLDVIPAARRHRLLHARRRRAGRVRPRGLGARPLQAHRALPRRLPRQRPAPAHRRQRAGGGAPAGAGPRRGRVPRPGERRARCASSTAAAARC